MAQSAWITAEAEVDAVVEALKGTSRSLTSIQKQALGIIARKGAQEIRKDIKSKIKDRTRSKGGLAKSYGFRVKRDGSEANIYPRGASGSDIFPKAMVQNAGHEGPTARARSWKVAPKAFVDHTENFLESKDFSAELSKMADKALKKYWG